MTERKGVSSWLRPALIVGTIIVLIIIGKLFGLPGKMNEALKWVQDLGMIGIVVFVAAYILSCVLFLPGSVLTLGAGVVYGVVKGSVIVSVASTLGATAAFLVGRYFARDWVNSKIKENIKFKSIDDAIGREGWKIVGLTRLSPIFPFNLLNYAFGLTKISLRQYVAASWIGMMPGTIMYVYIGSLAGELATLGAQKHTRTVGEWILYGVGLLAAVIVTVFVSRLAKNSLNVKIEKGDEG